MGWMDGVVRFFIDKFGCGVWVLGYVVSRLVI